MKAGFKKLKKRIISIIAGVVVFATSYALVLPAITLDEETAEQTPGIEMTAETFETGEDMIETVTEETADVAEEIAAEEITAEETAAAEVSETEIVTETAAAAEAVENPEAVPAETTAETVSPAQKFEEKLYENEQDKEADKPYLVVSVEADPGAFPEGTTMTVEPVSDPTVLDRLTEAVDGTVVSVTAVDITFYNADNTEIEPALPIRVTMTGKEIADADDTTVVHMDNEGQTDIVEQTDETLLETRPAEDQVVFASDAFSVYGIVGTVIEKRVLASDGHNYRITVTCGEEAGVPEGARLEVTEIPENTAEDGVTEYDLWLEKTGEALGIESDLFGYARFFDIRIVDENGEKIRISAPVDVKIELADKENGESEENRTQVVHFADGAEDGDVVAVTTEAAEEGVGVSFEAEGFSVYAIVEEQEPITTDSVKTLDELAENYGNKFYLSYGNAVYITDSLNNNNAFIETKNVTDASFWYLEKVDGQENQYYVYTINENGKQYMHNKSGNLMELDSTSKTAFELSLAAEGKFYFKVAGANKWLQHSNGGGGIRLWTDNNNATNSRIIITYAELPKDTYGLDGKTYGIAYHDDSATAAALTADSKTVAVNSQDQQRLQAVDMVMKPDVTDHEGILLVAEGSDIQEWTFESIAENRYYIKTAGKYLTINNGNVTLEEEPDPVNSVITVNPGTGSNSGKWHFTVNGYSLNLTGSTFNAATGNGAATWMNLVRKSTLEDDVFTLYNAKKVSVSDEVNVYDGQQVVLYTRVWNDTTKKYEFYVVDYNGSLIRCYDNGDGIEWVGSDVNKALWTFYEGKNSDGTPSYYYWLENTQIPKTTIRPTDDSAIYTSTKANITSDFNASVNLNGRRYGESFTTIIAWDDEGYSYTGLKVEDGKVVPCSLADADDFYFAVINPVDPGDGLTIVDTVDNDDYGITMRMVDFNNDYIGTATNFRDKDQHEFFGAHANGYEPGLLSTDLNEDGYPSTTELTGKEQPLSNLFTGMTDVNHLFLTSVYNESGYFEYDSTQNFATLLDENGIPTNTFTVYDQIAAIGQTTSNTRTHGQFMPYNEIEEGQYAYDANGNPITNKTDVLARELSDLDPRKGEQLYSIPQEDADYFFGMEMSASFTQTANGLDAWGHDIIFEFSGDDDFWLYVDKELVLDLGGVRSAMAGSVNFRTGVVKNGGNVTLITKNGSVTKSTYTLREVFESNYRKRNPNASEADVEAYLNGYFKEGTSVFKDYSTHTMNMFYMERGAGASNLHMRFNLAAVKPGTVELSKKLSGTTSASNSLIDFPYQIYYSTKDDGGNQFKLLGEKTGDDYNVTYKDSIRPVTYQESFTPAGGTTAYSDVFFLKAGETAVINLPKNTEKYYIVECGVNPDVYDIVSANGDAITGKSTVNTVGTTARQDFATTKASMTERSSVEFDNHVKEGAMRVLELSKKLYDADGHTVLSYADDSTLFTFRLYLGDENANAANLPLADLYPYYIKDPDGNYCRWDKPQQKFVSLGIADYNELITLLGTYTDAEKESVIFKTSMTGSISKIPAGYTVEVRDLIIGTQYKVEERDWEIPKGYTRREADGYSRTDAGHQTEQQTPYSGTMAKDETPHIEVRNQKGWGLTVDKVWTDKDFMESHDPIYIAVYVGEDLAKIPVSTTTTDPETGETTGSTTEYKQCVRALRNNETELYFYFGDLYNGTESTTYPFSDFTVREVKLEGETAVQLDDEGYVTNIGDFTVTRIEDGEKLTGVGGTPVGGEHRTDYEYTVSYKVGKSTGNNENIRTDTVTNSRPGIALYKSDWTGKWENNALTGALSDAVFTLKTADDTNADVAARSYTSDEDGLITNAYLSAGTYILTETHSPKGYVGLAEGMQITVGSDGSIEFSLGEDTVTMNAAGEVSGESKFFTVEKNTASGMTATVTIKNRQNELKAVKVDAADQSPISDVHFALYRQVRDSNGRLKKDTLPIEGYADLVTGNDGIIPNITLDLAAGTYYLEEIQSAEGYEKLSEDLCFTIGNDGTVTINNSTQADWLKTEINEGTGLTSYEITIPNAKLKKVSFMKVDNANTSAVLKGAEFDLYRVVNGVQEGTPSISGLVSDETGMLSKDGKTVFDLSVGTYHLIETKAPAGYIPKSAPVVITITDKTDEESKEFNAEGSLQGIWYQEGTALSQNGKGEKYDAASKIYTLKISNSAGVELPAAGGPGTRWFYILGVALLAAAFVLTMRRRCMVD